MTINYLTTAHFFPSDRPVVSCDDGP